MDAIPGPSARVRRRIALIGLGAILSGALANPAIADECAPDTSLTRFVSRFYPGDLRFDVVRNGKSIGSHVTSLNVVRGEIEAESQMNLSVSIFFIPVYSFRYSTTAAWCNDSLRRIESTVVENGRTRTISATTDGDRITVVNGENTIEGKAPIIPTNHWNPAVLDATRVLNTITGRINEVAIAPCETGSAVVEAGLNNAQCYEYSGELTTKVWYDAHGRWVGLEFAGSDGSTISYVCRHCSGTSG